MKKLPFKTFWIPVPTFSTGVRVIISENHNRVTTYLNKHFKVNYKNEDMDYRNGKTIFMKGYDPVLWLPRIPYKCREYGTLAHEAFHCAWDILSARNIHDEETGAYLIGQIVREFLMKTRP